MKFSVLMPLYVKENPDFLSQSLESILINQKITPNEVIIVEDGPLTEDLYSVLNNYENRFPQIIVRVKLPQNMGMGVAMNKGLEKAKYDWIARMDSDDIATSDRFEEQVNFIKENPHINVLGSAIEEFNTTIGDLSRYRVLPQSHDEIIRMMKKRNPINHMTVFFKREIALKANGYWHHRFFEDYNLWYEMSKNGATFHNLQKNLVFARVGNNMVARRQGINYFKYEKILLDKFIHDHFINRFEYFISIIVKFLLRILPVGILNLIYTFFLRKKSS